MKIKQIHIDEYGVYTNFQLDLTPSGSPLTIIYGANEAGKSTLHSFLRSMLFGFSLKGVPSYEAVPGGRLSGRITLEDGQGKAYYLERSTPPKKGKVAMFAEDGSAVDETTLGNLLGHVSAPLFTNIFAFGHQELQRLESLQGEEIAAYLYSAALGNGASQLVEVEKKMNKLRDALFRPRAANPLLNQLIKEVEEQELKVEKLHSKLASYTSLKESLIDLHIELQRLREHRESLIAERGLYEKLAKLIEIEAELAIFTEEYASLESLSCALLPHKATLQVLLYEEKRMKELEEEGYRLDEQIKTGQKKIGDYFSLLGAGWDSERLAKVEQSIAVQDSWIRLVRQKEEATTTLNRKQEECQEIEREIAAGRLSSGNRTRQRKLFSMLGLSAACLLPLMLLLVYDQPIAAVILLLSLLWFTKEQLGQWKVVQQQERRQTHLLAQLEAELEAQTAELAQLQGQLEKELLPQNLPSHISSGGLSQLLQTLRETLQELNNVTKLRQQKDRYTDELSLWQGNIQELASLVGVRTTENPYIILAELKQQFLQEEEVEAERKSLREKKQALLQEREQFLQTINTEQLTQSEFAQLAQNSVGQLQEVDKEMIQGKLADLQQEYADVLREIETVAKEQGKLETELDALVGEVEFSRQQQELEEKKAHFQQEAAKWATYSLAEYLCQQIRKVYEEERQPSVLKKASYFFEKMTLGRYKQIMIPFGEQKMLVIREDNLRLGVDQLSQGTVEQLYLAMRFAVVKDYEKIATLPLIMDDIFVNFDRERVKKALYGVAELARDHQIIYFTCHEHMLELAEEVLGQVNVVELTEAKNWVKNKGIMV